MWEPRATSSPTHSRSRSRTPRPECGRCWNEPYRRRGCGGAPGRGGARRARREGRVVCIVSGGNIDSLAPRGDPRRPRPADEQRQHARPQQPLLGNRSIGIDECVAGGGRGKAPVEEKVDRRVRAAHVAPVDDPGQVPAFDEHVSEMKVAMNERRRLDRWAARTPGRGAHAQPAAASTVRARRSPAVPACEGPEPTCPPGRGDRAAGRRPGQHRGARGGSNRARALARRVRPR